MKEMIKKLMVVLVSAFLMMGTVFTPVEAKGSNTSGTNGWRNPWGWFWGWGYPQPTQPEPEPEPTEEPVVEEEEPVVTEEPIVEEEPVVTEEPGVTEEPVIVEEPVIDEGSEAKAQEFDAVSLTEGYSATISFEEDAQIADGAMASIEEYAEDTEDFAAAKEAVLEAKGVEEDEIGFIAFDMTLYDAEGNEIEPDGGLVNVALSVPLPEEALNADEIEIHHIDRVTGEAIQVAATEDITVADDAANADLTVDGFSTFTITWRTGYNARTVTVHYVDESGNELTISNPDNTHPNMNANSSSPAFLIYDIDGYEYSYTYRNTNTNANRIAPLLAKNDNNRWMYNVTRNTDYWGNFTNWTGTELSNNDNIYVVYKKKTDPTAGGSVKPPTDTEWPGGDGAPKFGKSSIHNNNGKNTVALTIAAAEKKIESVAKANVIVVLDVSASMSSNMSGQTRMVRAQTAVRNLASNLLGKTDSQGNKLVKMALITFGGTANVVRPFTDNATTFNNSVPGSPNSGNTYQGATNWEQALNLANHMAVDSDAATFVVFVTDGDPTFRMTRGDYTNGELENAANSTFQPYREASVFGTGSDNSTDNVDKCFDAAVPEVKAIVAANKNFYAIGVSNDVQKVQTLCTDANVPADHAFRATDNDELIEAFDKIASSISSTLGYGDVGITDGVTELSSTRMEMLHSVDTKSFKYYKIDSTGEHEWTTREADGCAAATYNETNGTVEWNMGSGFQLEDGVTYKVTFEVWPSQEAYDLIADLNNGTKSYDSLTPEEKEQIVEITAVPKNTYTLKTNTDNVTASYKKTTKTGDVVAIADDKPISIDPIYGTIDNMPLTSMQLTIKKEFEDDLTAGEDRETEVRLVLKRRNANQETEEEFVNYPVPQGDGTTSEFIVLNDANNWTYSLYVAPGFKAEDEVLEHGYDFTIAEPDIDYHYGLIEEIINPMVVDGVDTYYGDGKLIDDDKTIDEYIDRSLTAVNRVKSGIDIRKVTVDPDGAVIQPDIEFTIKGKLLDANGNPFLWQEGDSVDNSGAYHKYDKDGNRIVYKGHFADTSNIEFTLKPGEYLRFINVPDGCTFEFEEDTAKMPADFEWNKTEAVTQHRTGPGGEFTPEGDVQPVVDADGKAHIDRDLENGLTGVVGNKQYSVTFTNKAVKGEWFYVYHSSDNTIEKIYTEDDRVAKTLDPATNTNTYTFNLVNETKAGYVYGGYYKAYGDSKLTIDQIKELDYTSSDDAVYEYAAKTTATENWASDENGVPYTGSKATAWKSANAYTDTDAGKGTEMHPVSGAVYYLKEVPDSYLRPYIHFVYDTYHKDENGNKDNPIIKLYIMTAVDDANYKDAGINYDGTSEKTVGKLSATVKITDASGKSSTLTAKSVFNGKTYDDGKALVLPRGYLTSIENTAALSSEKFEMRPYFKTLDGVKVYGVTNRTVEIGNGKYVADGDGNAIKPGITATNTTEIIACE